MFSSLRIPQFPQQYALNLVRAYSSGFADRVLPGFRDIEAEADAASGAYFDSRMNQVVSEDEPWVDEGAVAEDAQEHGFSVYTDLEFVRQQVTGLAIAGLYHLWERLVKEFLETSFRAVDPPVPRRKCVVRTSMSSSAGFESASDGTSRRKASLLTSISSTWWPMW